MSVIGSPFCEHKKLRTGCAICKASVKVEPTLQATPYVPQDEREKVAEKREARARAAERGEPVPTESKALGPRGPGKPLMPQRKKANRNISAAEADSVKPWWVKK
ncbi:MAG TPA: hypothetical protein VM370_11810 [Candidatus Thermoplasmatota archaeon]|nr:hypothetical protein [Candidatus Thermoplasmatota archaeon]